MGELEKRKSHQVNLDPYLTSSGKINSKRIVNLNGKGKSKFLEVNKGKYLHHLGAGKEFLNRIHKTPKGKDINWTSLTLTSVHQKSKKANQSERVEKLTDIYISNKYIKNYYKSVRERNLIEKWAKDEQVPYKKIISKLSVNMKGTQFH